MEDEITHKELAAAEKALAEGRYDAAQRLLNKAAESGATPRHIQDLHRRIRTERVRHEFAVQNSVFGGFGIAFVGYLLLCIRQPLGWGIPLWLALAVGVVPCAAGGYVGRRHAGEREPGASFRDGAKSVAGAMVCYSGFSTLILVSRLQKGALQLGEEAFAALLTTALLTIVAAGMAGVASVAASRIGVKRTDASA